MSKKLDFNFHVGGLKAAILGLLKNGNPLLIPAHLPMTGVKKFASYDGEFNAGDATSSIKALTPHLPAVLVAYGSGKDRPNAATGMLHGEPIEFEHSCGFVVIVACNNLRIGGAQRTTTVDQMVSEARQLLGGVQFEIDVSDEGQPAQMEPLNHTPLMFDGVENLLLLSDLTALAVSFTTSFKEWTPNRRVVSAGTADEILLDMENGGNNIPHNVLNDGRNLLPEFNTPGVVGEKL